MVLVVGVAAAVITALVVATSSRTYAERLDIELSSSRGLADETLAQVTADLIDNPLLPLRQVLEGERSRVCGADGTLHDAGDAWPLDRCGADWTYQPWGTNSLDPGRAEFTILRDPSTSRWSVAVLGRSGVLIDAGWRRTLVRSTLADTTAFSQGPLNLTDGGGATAGGRVYVEADDIVADGLTVYASGTIRLPSSGTDGSPDDIRNAVIAADPDTGSPFVGDDTFMCAGAAPCEDRVILFDDDGTTNDIRYLAAQPWTLATAQAGVAQALDVACPASTSAPGAFVRMSDGNGDGVPDDTNDDGDVYRNEIADVHTAQAGEDHRPHPEDGQAVISHLCLRPGNRLLDLSTGSTVTVPTATAVNISPYGTGAGPGITADPDGPAGQFNTAVNAPALRIRWRTDGTEPDGNDCATACDLRRVSAAAVEDGVHPGVEDFWTEPGATLEAVVWMPSTGVVATPHDTYLGWCDDHIDRAGSCGFGTALDGDAGDGVDWTEPLTIIAGTVADPASIWIGNTQDATAPLGLVATNEVILGYWARQPYSPLAVDAHAVALGLGDASGRSVASTLFVTNPTVTTSAIRPAPSHVCEPQMDVAACADNQGTELVWTGSVAAPGLDLSHNMWERVVLAPAPDAVDSPPPFFPAVDPHWRTLTTAPYSGHSACAQAVCLFTP